jgi:hypothetical protein
MSWVEESFSRAEAEIMKLMKERDELLDALKYARSNGIFATHVVSDIDLAIAKASHEHD